MKLNVAKNVILAALFAGALQAASAQELDLRGSYVAVSLASLEHALSIVKPGGASNSMSLGFNSFSAAIIQANPPDLIIVGRHQGSLPDFTTDNLATLMQVSAMGVSGDLGISLEAKANDLRTRKLVPRFIGATAANCIGSAAFRADYEMKRIALEKEPSGIGGLPSYSSRMKQQLEQLRAHTPDSPINILSRFWFTPVYTPVLTNDGGNLLLLLPPTIQVNVETLSVNGKAPGEFRDEAAESYARDFTAAWLQLVSLHPSFADMQRFVSAIKLFTVLDVEITSGSPLAGRLSYWQKIYHPAPVFIPPEVDLIENSTPGSREYVIGGVRLGSLTFRMGKHDIDAFREAVLATRPNPDVTSWPFVIDRDWHIQDQGIPPAIIETGRLYGEALNEYDRASASSDPGLMAHAFHLFEAVARQAPDSPEPRLLRAMSGRDLALLEGRLTNALPSLTTLSNLSAEYPNLVEPRFELGKTLLILGRGDEAVSALNKVVQAYPDFAPAQQALGLACRSIRDYAAARKHLELYLKLCADTSDPLARQAEQALREMDSNTGKSRDLVEFHSPRHGLRFPVPNNWHRLSPEAMQRIPGNSPDSLVTVFCQPDDPDDNVNVRSEAIEADSLSDQDAHDAITMLDAAYPKQFDDFRKIDAGVLKVGDATGIRYHFALSRAGVPLEQTVVTLVQSRTMLTLTFTAKQQDFQALWQKTYQPLLDGLQWNPK